MLRGMINVPWHVNLLKLYSWVELRFQNTIITCAYEPRNYSSVHSVIPLRGLDIRSRVYNNPEAIVVAINKVWDYDPKRRGLFLCAKYHDAGRGAHIHLQVHDNTEFLGPIEEISQL